MQVQLLEYIQRFREELITVLKDTPVMAFIWCPQARVISKWLTGVMVVTLSACSIYGPVVGESSGTVVRQSILRVGDLVTFSRVSGHRRTQIAVDCISGNTWFLYSDVAGRRLYPGGSARYKAALVQSAQENRNQADLAIACSRASDLRLIHEEADGLQVLVDLSTIARAGENNLQAWVTFDYASVLYDPPYNAPFGQKRELLRVNCRESMVSVLAGYDVEAEGMVTDGLLFQAPQPTLAVGSYKTATDAICSPSSFLESRPTWSRRAKQMVAVDKKPPAIDPVVLRKIAALGVPIPVRSLRGLKTEGTSTYEGRTEPLRLKYEIRPNTAVGVFQVQQIGDGFQSNIFSFLGLQTLSSASEFASSNSFDSSVLSNVDFEGDWVNMPIGSHLRVKIVEKGESSMVGRTWTTRGYTCTVKREAAASALHPVLGGAAKEILCEDPADKFKRVSQYWFLVDYGYFFRVGDSPNSFYSSTQRITAVEE